MAGKGTSLISLLALALLTALLPACSGKGKKGPVVRLPGGNIDRGDQPVRLAPSLGTLNAPPEIE